MTETTGLVAVLAAVYALECVLWMPARAWCLHASWLRSFHLAPDASSFRLGERALIGLNPLPPYGETFVLPESPIQASPDAVRLEGDSTPHRWDEFAMGSESRPLKSFAERLADRGVSAPDRQYWLSVVTRVASLAPRERAAALEETLARRLNLRAARERARMVRDVTQTMRIIGSTQWLLIAIGLPMGAALGQLSTLALPLFGLILFVHAGLVWMAGNAHLDLHGERPGFGDYLMLAVSPLHAMRASEHVSRHGMVEYDRHAVLLAVGRPEDFLAMARSTWRGLGVVPADEPADIAWWRQAQQQSLSRLLREARVHPSHFELATQEDDGAKSFCPECRTLYSLEGGFCQDCGGVALRRLNQRQVEDARRVMARMDERVRGKR